MLEFSDASYQFFPAEPDPFFMWLVRQANHLAILKGPNHKVRSIEISGATGEVERLRDRGARMLFVANHPSHSDPQLMIEIQRRLKVHSAFMAAYDVFLRSQSQAWFMQKMGCFSIDREGSDRKAMSAAIDILKKGDLALTIFPEGNVYLINDRLTPFLDGTSFIAVKAQQALKGEGEIWVVPVSFKFTQLTNVKSEIWVRLKELGDKLGVGDRISYQNPKEAVMIVGGRLLSQFLNEKTDIGGEFDFSDSSPEEIRDSLLALAKRLIGDLEDELELERNEETYIVDRVRKVRTRIHQIKIGQNNETTMPDAKIECLADRAILSFRILAYVLPYFNEKPTLDRYAETVERLCEDSHSKSFRPPGSRRAMARISEPFSVQALLDEHDGKSRAAIPELTRRMESQIQAGIDELNESNKALGGELL